MENIIDQMNERGCEEAQRMANITGVTWMFTFSGEVEEFNDRSLTHEANCYARCEPQLDGLESWLEKCTVPCEIERCVTVKFWADDPKKARTFHGVQYRQGTTHGIYLLGLKPKFGERDCFAIGKEIWYVATYFQPEVLEQLWDSAARARAIAAAPFGPYFLLHEWQLETSIDLHEPEPLSRITTTVVDLDFAVY